MTAENLIQPIEPYSGEGEGLQATEDNFLHVRNTEANRQLSRLNTKRMGTEELEYTNLEDLLAMTEEPVFSKMTTAERRALRGRGLTLGQLQFIFGTDASAIVEIEGAKVTRSLDIALSFLDPQEYFLARNNGRPVTVFIPISEYAKLTKKSNKTRAKADLKETLESLEELKFKDPKLDGFLRLIESYYYVPKKIYGEAGYEVTFTQLYIALLAKNGYNADLPKALMGVDVRYYGLAYMLGKELYSHSNRNLNEANETLLKISTVLDFAKGYLPSEEDVRASGSRYTELIVAPLEKNLEILKEEGVLKDWNYCHKGGDPLTAEEEDLRIGTAPDGSAEDKPMDYKVFKTLYLTWELAEEYDREGRTKKRLASRKRKETAKKNKEARQQKNRAAKEQAYAEELGKQQAREEVAKAKKDDKHEEEPLHFD